MYRGRRVAAIVLARQGSSRLPGKVLLPFGEDSVLSTVLDRLKKTQLIDEIVLATTEESADDALVKAADAIGVTCLRGPTHDVVARMRAAELSLAEAADVIVRGCADNPLVMPTVVDDGVRMLVDTESDVVTPFEHATYPFGFGLVSMTSDCLRRIDEGASHPSYREHVENYCFEHPREFEVVYQKAPPGQTYPELIATLDWRVDYDRLVNYEELVRDLPLEEQPRALVEHVRSARVWIEGRSRTAPEGVDLILCVNPIAARAPRGVVVVDTFPWYGSERRGLRYSTETEPIYLEPDGAPEGTDIEFLHRAVSDFLPTLLAGPVRPVSTTLDTATTFKYVNPENRENPLERAG